MSGVLKDSIASIPRKRDVVIAVGTVAFVDLITKILESIDHHAALTDRDDLSRMKDLFGHFAMFERHNHPDARRASKD